MRLDGARCAIRQFRRGDVDAIARHANNLEVARQLRDRFPHPYTRDDARRFVRMATETDDDPRFLAIEVDGEAAGTIGVVAGSDVERYSGEIGYWLGEPFWGRGIATEAVTLLTAHAFEHSNLLRLFALPFADNIPSARVLEKAGYVREALLRASAVKYGRPRDQWLYARVNDRWVPPLAAEIANS